MILPRFVISFKRLESKILGIGNTQQTRHSLKRLKFSLALHLRQKHSQNISFEFYLPVYVHTHSVKGLFLLERSVHHFLDEPFVERAPCELGCFLVGRNESVGGRFGLVGGWWPGSGVVIVCAELLVSSCSLVLTFSSIIYDLVVSSTNNPLQDFAINSCL